MATGMEQAAMAGLKTLLPIIAKTDAAQKAVADSIATVATFDARLREFEERQAAIHQMLIDMRAEMRAGEMRASGYNSEQISFAEPGLGIRSDLFMLDGGSV